MKMEQKVVAILPKEELAKEMEIRQKRIDALTKFGEKRIADLHREIRSVKSNHQIPKEAKEDIIIKDKVLIEEAKKVALTNKEELKRERKEFYQLVSSQYGAMLKEKAASNKKEKEEAKLTRNKLIEEAKATYKAKLAEIKTDSVGASTKEAKEEARSNLIAAKKAYMLSVEEAKEAYNNKVTENKDARHQMFQERSSAIKNASGKYRPIQEYILEKFEEKVYKFNMRDFIFNNGLYVVIVLAIIFLTIGYAVANDGAFLFKWSVIVSIVEQSSPRLFFSLGVAGLIVLAGTDLSVGRMIGMGGVLTVMFCTTSGIPDIKFLGQTMDFSAIPLWFRVILGFLCSTVACTFFSCLAGFFTAKFKMHPFISTLANQLIIFGGMVLLTENGFTGMPNNDLITNLTGRIDGTFPIMIIYAIVLIIVMWFIWNKTKFGKNMFAVGGNPEAAAVSGISVFWTTMGVFLMAGILYGLGSSIFGIYSTSVKAQNGTGMESDAIAACVVGGVSFSGGVGTIHGVVIGTLLFQAISFILPYIGIGDSNAQLFVKGIIILVAVTFDCAKFLKKK